MFFLRRNDRSTLPITFQLLRSHQPSGLYSTRTGLACQDFLQTKAPMSCFQHRLVRLQYRLVCVSDGRRLLCCQRFVFATKSVHVTGLGIIHGMFVLSSDFVVMQGFLRLSDTFPMRLRRPIQGDRQGLSRANDKRSTDNLKSVAATRRTIRYEIYKTHHR
jgi:hypothetical protein